MESSHIAEKPNQAEQVGRAFGLFQKRLSDLPSEKIQETIPQFHNGALRLQALEQAINEDLHGRASKIQDEIDFCRKHKDIVHTFTSAINEGKLPVRITHNDTKIDNVLLDNESGEVMCIVDLDTVMPGLVHYDFGDMVRTLTSPADEDDRNLEKVTIRMEFFEALSNGYLSEAKSF